MTVVAFMPAKGTSARLELAPAQRRVDDQVATFDLPFTSLNEIRNAYNAEFTAHTASAPDREHVADNVLSNESDLTRGVAPPPGQAGRRNSPHSVQAAKSGSAIWEGASVWRIRYA